MNLLSFEVEGTASFGCIKDGNIVDLGRRLPIYSSLRDVIEQDAISRTIQTAQASPIDYTADDITFLPPVPNARKIICVGVNYANRNAEYKDGSSLPDFPSLFIRFPDSFVGHEQNIMRPVESEKYDYEGEIVLVIGKPGRRISKDTALSHIAGLTLMNEGTLRDWVRHAKFNVTQGKNFDRSGAIGPWMVPADHFEALEDLHISTRVNSDLRQDDTTANMMFPFQYLLAYISTFTTLRAGDMIATGTPPGAGARFDPPKFLRAGDTVEISSPEIGTLRNIVVDETRSAVT